MEQSDKIRAIEEEENVEPTPAATTDTDIATSQGEK
jgi:hypothetical protein